MPQCHHWWCRGCITIGGSPCQGNTWVTSPSPARPRCVVVLVRAARGATRRPCRLSPPPPVALPVACCVTPCVASYLLSCQPPCRRTLLPIVSPSYCHALCRRGRAGAGGHACGKVGGHARGCTRRKMGRHAHAHVCHVKAWAARACWGWWL